jgi:hypothetical protein
MSLPLTEADRCPSFNIIVSPFSFYLGVGFSQQRAEEIAVSSAWCALFGWLLLLWSWSHSLVLFLPNAIDRDYRDADITNFSEHTVQSSLVRYRPGDNGYGKIMLVKIVSDTHSLNPGCPSLAQVAFEVNFVSRFFRVHWHYLLAVYVENNSRGRGDSPPDGVVFLRKGVVCRRGKGVLEDI